MKKYSCVLFLLFCVYDLQSQTLARPPAKFCGGIMEAAEHLRSNQKARTSSQLFSARTEPIAVRKGVDEFRLMLGVKDSSVVSVEFKSISFDLLFDVLYQGQRIDTIRLYDDGTHGDERARDKVFTADQLTLQARYASIDPIFALDIRFSEVIFVFADGAQETYTEDVGLTVHYYDPSIVSVPQTTRLAEDVQTTAYVVNVSATLAGVFPQQRANPREIAKRYYDFFADERDMLILAHTFAIAGGAEGSFTHVRNDVEGIGMPVFDQATEYGSSGRLQGIITVQYGHAFPWLLTHEVLHRWAVSVTLDPSLDLGNAGSGHWGAIQRNSTGFGEGGPYNGVFSKLEHLSGDRYRATGANVAAHYSDLELYFMGLLPLSEVETPIIALVNPRVLEFGETYIYQADGMRAVEVNEIVARHGPRIPDPLEAQKHFTAAMVLVHDRLLSDVELAYYDFLAREYEKAATEKLSGLSEGLTFEAAAGGRATLQTRLSAPGTGVQANGEIPEEIRLGQNYPNPFNPETTIEYELSNPALVKLTIYNVLGQPVRVLVNGWQNAGKHRAVWKGLQEHGKTDVASSLYVYELRVGGTVLRKKMILLQ